MARINNNAWIPEPTDSQVIAQIQQASAAESRLKRINMTSDIQKVPRIGGTRVEGIAKGATYPESPGELDNVQLDAVKFGTSVSINWEDLEDSASDVFAAFIAEWAANYSKTIDNAIFATSGTANGTSVPFDSVYSVAKKAGGNFTETAGALSYDHLSNALGFYENSSHFDESGTFLVAAPSVKASLRNLKDSVGRPLFVESMIPNQPSTYMGYPIVFNGGLRVSETNTATPNGNPLIVIGNGNRGLLGDRSPVESQVSEEVGFLSDGVVLKTRRRVGFKVAEASAFSVIEISE